MMMSKLVLRTMYGVTLASALTLAAAGAQTTDPVAPPPPPAGQGPGMGGGEMAQRFQQMKDQLNLTPDQTQQVRAIMMDGWTKISALRSNTSLSQRDQRQQMMAIHNEETGKINAILSPDQQKKFAEMQAQMRAEMRQRMLERRQQGGGQTPPPAPPPQDPQ